MKQITSVLLCIMMFPMLSFTTKQDAAPIPTAKITWAKELHDFGDIPKGTPVSVEFSFTNAGDEPLLIADVKTSCGCTASDYTRQPIAPGKSSKVKVTFSAASAGAFNKNVTVSFNEPSLQKVLNIRGTVH